MKMNVRINRWVDGVIKKHATFSSWEIYGWMIGYEGVNDTLYVLSVIPCDRYDMQHSVGAAPNPMDVQEISKSLPIGLGIIGFYHSHPDEVFHSSTDDKTLENLSRHYPHMISAVTNGKITKWFMYNSGLGDSSSIEKRKSKAIDVTMIDIINDKIWYLPITINVRFALHLSDSKPLIPQLTRTITENYNESFDRATYIIANQPKILNRLHDKNRFFSFDLHNVDLPSDKIIQKGKLKELKTDFQSLLTNAAPYLQITLEISNKSNAARVPSLIVKSEILALVKAPDLDIDINTTINRLRIEIMESILTKIGQSVDLIDVKGGERIQLLIPDSAFLKYPLIPIRISLWLKELKKIPRTPKSEKIMDIEEKRLDSWKNKFVTLARTDLVKKGIKLLKDLQYIFQLRGDKEHSEKIETVIELINGMKK